MPRASVADIEIEYTTTGRANDPPLLLLMGTGASLAFWDDEFCDRLARTGDGFFVVRFDARDTGRSSRTEGQVPETIPALMAAFGSGQLVPPYGLERLADDAVELLQVVVGNKPAHIVGISLGGALTQLIGLRAPKHAATLTMIQGYSSDPATPPPSAATMAALLGPFGNDDAGMIARELMLYRLTGSRSRPPDEAWLRRRAERVLSHGYHPQGFLKHLLAVISASNRKPLLSSLRCPTLVVHGDEDPIIPLAEGRAMAQAIPGARLLVPAGMGHDLAPEFWDPVIAGIAALAATTLQPRQKVQ